MKICPHCNREIPVKSIKCRYCKRRMDDPVRDKGGLFRMKMIAACLIVCFFITGAVLILIERSSDTAHYINRTENIRISHPKEWKVLDRSNYTTIFNSLKRKLNSENDNLRLVCAFSCTKNFRELSPLIIVAVRPISDDSAALSSEDLRQFLAQALRDSPDLTEDPMVTEMGGKEFVRYVSTSNVWDIEWRYIYYHLIEDNRLYLISLWTRANLVDNYEPVLRNILKSLKFL